MSNRVLNGSLRRASDGAQLISYARLAMLAGEDGVLSVPDDPAFTRHHIGENLLFSPKSQPERQIQLTLIEPHGTCKVRAQ